MAKNRKTKSSKASVNSTAVAASFGESLGFVQLAELATEFFELRQSPPVVTRTPGHREGDILGFVRGLRLSARLIYFLRERLSHTEYKVSWGHLLDKNLASCSPECDIIIHAKGHIKRWNGGEMPVMDFRFVPASTARVVISCKSALSAIDRRYPGQLRGFGVRNVLLFAECCEAGRFTGLERSAKAAGYKSLCCLYLTEGQQIIRDEKQYAKFVKTVLKAVK
jgi:hypothetical protein